ncbi:hypothetical protein GPECTOR_7g1120 [Gonium pectorale]|uniref:U-box domain-containing protein n=1 Tax=Gonium pectorale TaxID=33097 RepID=A0A150GTP0_GONPE|nr:hypothetical protein GPECTOR_7g1120 [Gonium pectorale]|eukprot:KXZ53227.1 hypothetical protein GPECTOR_7g1120 [Gonium pectorale]
MTLSTSNSLRVASVEADLDSASDAYLFETPVELLCPITLQLFHDPVVNEAGQVYERSALVKALAHRLVDPISNLPLATGALTTVWPMKSKACLRSPGLTPALVDYVLSHGSSIYDSQALIRFAASLATCGERDMAACVYTKLLQQLEAPSAQQVEALKGLLGCWGDLDEDDDKLVQQLAGLACEEGPEGCRPARFVNVLLEGGLSEEFVLRFCEHILSNAMRYTITGIMIASVTLPYKSRTVDMA